MKWTAVVDTYCQMGLLVAVIVAVVEAMVEAVDMVQFS